MKDEAVELLKEVGEFLRATNPTLSLLRRIDNVIGKNKFYEWIPRDSYIATREPVIGDIICIAPEQTTASFQNWEKNKAIILKCHNNFDKAIDLLKRQLLPDAGFLPSHQEIKEFLESVGEDDGIE